jgi:hypothetical protein
MTTAILAPRMRRIGLYALILLAMSLLGASSFVLLGGVDDGGGGFAEDFQREDDPPLDLRQAPLIEFPENVRSYDSAVNRLIDRLIRTSREGRYSEFRTLWTRRLDPVSAEEYAHIWSRIRRVRVLSLTRSPSAPAGGEPSYLLQSEVELDESTPPDKRTRRVRLMIVQENDEWVFAPLPPRQAAGTP